MYGHITNFIKMRSFFLIIALLISTISFNAYSWVYTTLNPHKNGNNYYYSQPIKISSIDGKLTFKLCIAQYRPTGKLNYFFIYLPPEPQYLIWDTPEKAPVNYKDGSIMKVRDGMNEVFDMTVMGDSNWKIEVVKQKKGETLGGSPIFEETREIEQIEVLYNLSKEDLYRIVDNGFKKIRIENTSPDGYWDFNFSEKQTKESAKDIRKHLNNMMKKVEETERALVKSREELKNKKPEPQKKKVVEEF